MRINYGSPFSNNIPALKDIEHQVLFFKQLIKKSKKVDLID